MTYRPFVLVMSALSFAHCVPKVEPRDGAGINPCSLTGGGNCESNDPAVVCCPMTGRPIDFERRCTVTAEATFYCYPRPAADGACAVSSAGACYQRPTTDGAVEAFFTANRYPLEFVGPSSGLTYCNIAVIEQAHSFEVCATR